MLLHTLFPEPLPTFPKDPPSFGSIYYLETVKWQLQMKKIRTA